MMFSVFLSLFGIVAAAEPCNIAISMINQDPYPAIPGDYVKVVFQIDGIENPQCGTVLFGIKEDYPVYLDPNAQNPITIRAGTYQKDYGSFYLAPYRLRIDENALDGENPFEVYYSTVTNSKVIKDFNISVEDTRADFEINVKNYDYNTRALTFEILNIGKTNVKALTLEIPKQDDLEIKGANRNVVGDLDSNEYTTADFEAILPQKETTINMNILYTDSIDVRREMQKAVNFDPSYFTGREQKKKQPYWLYALVIVAIVFFIWRRRKKKKKEAERRKRHAMS